MNDNSILNWIARYQSNYQMMFGVLPDQVRLPASAWLGCYREMLDLGKDNFVTQSKKDPILINGVPVVFYGRDK